MSPPERAASKDAAKATKTSAAHHPNSHDLRRAFEHFGRIEMMRASGLSAMSLGAVDIMVLFARHEWEAGFAHNAADLLRAAEHICFGARLFDSTLFESIPPILHDSVIAHFRELMHRADHHWHDASHPFEFVAVYKFAQEMANQAIERNAYQAALEYARAAEALAHLRLHSGISTNHSPDVGSRLRPFLQFRSHSLT